MVMSHFMTGMCPCLKYTICRDWHIPLHNSIPVTWNENSHKKHPTKPRHRDFIEDSMWCEKKNNKTKCNKKKNAVQCETAKHVSAHIHNAHTWFNSCFDSSTVYTWCWAVNGREGGRHTNKDLPATECICIIITKQIACTITGLAPNVR